MFSLSRCFFFLFKFPNVDESAGKQELSRNAPKNGAFFEVASGALYIKYFKTVHTL